MEQLGDLSVEAGGFWVEENGITLHLRLAGDRNPNGLAFEISTREQVFAPAAATGWQLRHEPVPPGQEPAPRRADHRPRAGHRHRLRPSLSGTAPTWARSAGTSTPSCRRMAIW